MHVYECPEMGRYGGGVNRSEKTNYWKIRKTAERV